MILYIFSSSLALASSGLVHHAERTNGLSFLRFFQPSMRSILFIAMMNGVLKRLQDADRFDRLGLETLIDIDDQDRKVSKGLPPCPLSDVND